MCSMSGYLHLIVPAEQFKLLKGEASLSTYTFNTGTARHRFCAVCGVKSFYIPRSHPQGISVNARCLDGVDFSTLCITPFDGRDWEKGRAEYRDT